MENNNPDISKRVAKFISFHAHTHASFYNTIDLIILQNSDQLEEIDRAMNVLNRDYIFIQYSGDRDSFLGKLQEELSKDTIVFLTLEKEFDQVTFDQLMRIRETNTLFTQPEKDTPINLNAKMFLVIDKNFDSIQVKELVDRILDLNGGGHDVR